MRTRILILLASMVIISMPACLEEDDPYSDPVTKFLGTWKVTENCNRLNYTVEILQDPGNSAQVLIYNFGNPGAGYDPAVGLVVSNSVYINSQTIGEGWTIDGKGTYQANGTISWAYTLFIPPTEYTCSATFSE